MTDFPRRGARLNIVRQAHKVEFPFKVKPLPQDFLYMMSDLQRTRVAQKVEVPLSEQWVSEIHKSTVLMFGVKKEKDAPLEQIW